MTAHAKRQVPHLAALFQAVTTANRPNHTGAQQSLTHGLNIEQWSSLTNGHDDPLLVKHLTYGFPLGFATRVQPQSDQLNHPLAQRAPQAISDYLNQEITHKAIAGPFDMPPFTPWFHISPMMVRDKKDSQQKRVIVDLSWPLGWSVNANNPTDTYEGAPASMTLPTPVDLAQAILQAPPTAHLFCLDLSRVNWPTGMAIVGPYLEEPVLFRPLPCLWGALACRGVSASDRGITFHLGKRGHHRLAVSRRYSRPSQW